MPLQCRHARVFRTFSGTFRVFLVCPQEWHSRPQASPHFHRGCARLCTRWYDRPRGGIGQVTSRERRRALASMSCKGPSVDRSCDASGRSGFASGPSGPVTGHCGELPRRTDLLLCLIGTPEGVRRRFLCPGGAARQELFGNFPLFSRRSACRPQNGVDLHRLTYSFVGAVDIPVDSYRRSVAQPGGALERRGRPRAAAARRRAAPTSWTPTGRPSAVRAGRHRDRRAAGDGDQVRRAHPVQVGRHRPAVDRRRGTPGRRGTAAPARSAAPARRTTRRTRASAPTAPCAAA